MNLYKITRGQLITLWLFGLILELFCLSAAMDYYDSSKFAGLCAILIPAALIFYTLGWRKHNKRKGKSNPKGVLIRVKDFVKKLFSRKEGQSSATQNQKKADTQQGIAKNNNGTGLLGSRLWQISDKDLERQIDNYNQLKFLHSFRGISVLLLAISFTLGFLIYFSTPESVWEDFVLSLIIYGIVAALIYRGKSTAPIIVLMGLYTYEKIFQIVGGYNLVWTVIWWLVFMSQFYKTYVIEREMKKNRGSKKKEKQGWGGVILLVFSWYIWQMVIEQVIGKTNYELEAVLFLVFIVCALIYSTLVRKKIINIFAMKALVLIALLIVMPVSSAFIYREFLREPSPSGKAIIEDIRNISQENMMGIFEGEVVDGQVIDNPKSELGKLINSSYAEANQISIDRESKIDEVAERGCFFEIDNVDSLEVYKSCMESYKFIEIDFAQKMIKLNQTTRDKLANWYESDFGDAKISKEGEIMYQFSIDLLKEKVEILERYYDTEVDLVNFLIAHQDQFYIGEDSVRYFDTDELADTYNALIALSQESDQELNKWYVKAEASQNYQTEYMQNALSEFNQNY